jgi:hypothetical protein
MSLWRLEEAVTVALHKIGEKMVFKEPHASCSTPSQEG